MDRISIAAYGLSDRFVILAKEYNDPAVGRILSQSIMISAYAV